MLTLSIVYLKAALRRNSAHGRPTGRGCRTQRWRLTLMQIVRAAKSGKFHLASE